LNTPIPGQMPMGAPASPGTSPQGDMPFQPQQMPLTPPEPPEQSPEDLQEDQQERDYVKELQRVNIAEKLDDEELEEISTEVKRGYESDLSSMKDWLDANKEWSKLARQVKEEKTFPWPGASNIKYPLISTAALQFSARAYPSLVPADKKVVGTRVYGADPSGEKRKKADRIATFMSWQVTEDMPQWEEEMDKLLIMNPVLGQSYKKTYFCPIQEKNESYLVYPENFVTDYWTRDLCTSMRYSEIIPMTEQDIIEHQLRDYFLDVDLGEPTGDKAPNNADQKSNDTRDYTTPYTIIETHTWLDLDEDELREPYIVWWELNSGKILRIQARFTAKDIKINDDHEVVGYKAKNYYTKFGFIPNPDGSFFDLGFGHLLGPINEAVNSIINQLVDSGTLQNLQGGFIAKGLRLNMADTTWIPGQWKAVNATGDDLRKQIVPLPTKEPAPVLFQLLGMLVQSGKELASVAEIFTGKMPGQNTPATTTQATIEQGMKVFTAIYKRLYRSLDEEFKKLFELNETYLNPETYAAVLDEPVGPEDFDKDEFDIVPAADPTATTQGEKMQKAQVVMQLLSTGLIDPTKAVMRFLDAAEIPNWQELIPGMAETGKPMPPQQAPDPKLEAIKAKQETDNMRAQNDIKVQDMKMQMAQQSEATKLQMKQEAQQVELEGKRQAMVLKAQSERQKQDIFSADARQKMIQGLLDGRQKLNHKEQVHQQKLRQTKEVQSSKRSQRKTSTTGGKTR
jgi:chaperonin GroES